MGRTGNGGRVSQLDGEAPESTDYANYFCTYSYIYHQKDMLEDHKRTGAYYMACMQNRAQFANRVVLDVGTGSGILAIFAAKAGARKVYAVEATSMAQAAKRLVTAQGLDGVVEVIQGVVESVEIPEKVDIIISEWMGYFLLRESMLDSVLVARDRFLKEDGSLYPSHARMLMAPVRSNLSAHRIKDFGEVMRGWGEFLEDMRRYYEVDMECLTEDFRKEQKEYYSQTVAWADIHPSQMLGPPAIIKEYNLRSVTLEELKAPLKVRTRAMCLLKEMKKENRWRSLLREQTPLVLNRLRNFDFHFDCLSHVRPPLVHLVVQSKFSMRITEDGSVEAFAGFFDTAFNGSPENPADVPVTLSTAPDPTGATHWGQQSFMMHPPLHCVAGSKIECDFEMQRRTDNHRLLEVKMVHRVVHGEKAFPERESHFLIE